MKRMVSIESTKPNANTGTARTPMANEDTTMLAASHWLIVSKASKMEADRFAYHRTDFKGGLVGAFICRNGFQASLLDAQPSS